MSKPPARPEALAGVLGLDPSLVATLDDPRALSWQLLACCLAIGSVALICGLLLASCEVSLALGLAGAGFAALCTLNLMRLVHACAGLAGRAGLAPAALLFTVALILSQAVCATALDDELSLASAWQQHPVLAVLLSLLSVAVIGSPAILRLALPESSRSFERAQRALIERRIASQRDTCAELCDSLLAYELDRLEALDSR
ncbi:MAG TPA: hypothetical protein VFX59_19750 [Polyangiales bacterium]|nr:hypothetical protein [Polyangiales bacterium]